MFSLSSFKFSWWAPKDARVLKHGACFTALNRLQGHPRSLILSQIESAYTCNFLLVVNSNIGPILPRFRDIAGFLLKTTPHPYSTRILGVFPLDYRLPMLWLRGAKTLVALHYVHHAVIIIHVRNSTHKDHRKWRRRLVRAKCYFRISSVVLSKSWLIPYIQ